MKSPATLILVVGVTLCVVGDGMAGDACGGGEPRSCWQIGTTPGCADRNCCTAVCAFDSFCCDVEWDSICRHNAVQLCAPPTPSNDRVSGAIEVTPGSFEVCTVGATDSADTALSKGCGGMLGSDIRRDVWFRFAAARHGTARLSSCPDAATGVYSEFDPIVVIRTEAGLEVACNDEMPDCGGYAEVEWSVRAGDAFLLQVGGHDSFVGYGRFLLEEDGVLPPPPCPADLTGDGFVSAADITTLLSGWGTPFGDANGDGLTNAQDITTMLGAWGPCP